MMGTDPYFFLWQYLNARPEAQQIMRDMLAIMKSPEADRDERAAARLTLNETMGMPGSFAQPKFGTAAPGIVVHEHDDGSRTVLMPREMIVAGQRASGEVQA